ncbi:MAG: hypothetical protein HYS04_15900 [Acidobacteria bacterium]|nr:hypothetical protein [Acidobacteriota bacterium]
MRAFAAVLVTVLTAGITAVSEEARKPPEKLVFKAKPGDVVFDHAKHIKAAKNDCKVCHDRFWPQSAKAPLNFKAGLHKPAEAKHTSCGFCHHPGGGSFESKGNCNRCHHKGTGKT